MKTNLEVFKVLMSIVDSSHVLHQYVHLTTSIPGHIYGYDSVPFENPHSHLER